MNVSIK